MQKKACASPRGSCLRATLRTPFETSRKKAVSRPAEVPKPQPHSVSAAPMVPPNAASIRQVLQKAGLSSVSTQSTHRHDQTRKATSQDGVATPLELDSEHTTRDLPSPQTPTESQMTTLVRPTAQRSMTVSLAKATARPERSRTMPLPSTSYTAASPSGNVTSTSISHSHPTHHGEISLVSCLLFG